MTHFETENAPNRNAADENRTWYLSSFVRVLSNFKLSPCQLLRVYVKYMQLQDLNHNFNKNKRLLLYLAYLCLSKSSKVSFTLDRQTKMGAFY